jgi:hypothetical protein
MLRRPLTRRAFWALVSTAIGMGLPLLACLAFLVSLLFQGQAKAPAELTMNGEPLQPLCIMQVIEDFGRFPEGVRVRIPTENCENGMRLEPSPAPSIQNNQFTFTQNFSYAEDTEDSFHMRPPFAEYRVMGPYDGGTAIEWIWSGGGTGVFSSILILKQTPDGGVDILRALYGGDRCNGGIQESTLTPDGTLETQLSITPYDYLWLGKPKGFEVHSGVDLASCAACCAGTALYIDEDFFGVNIEGLEESWVLQDTGGDYPQIQLACFKQLIQDRAAKGLTFLGPALLEAFQNEFDAKCLKGD